MLSGNREECLHAEAAEVFCLGKKLIGVDFVDREEEGLAGTDEESGEFDVRRGKLGTAVDYHDDELRLIEGSAGLTEDLCGNEIRVVRNDATGVDETRSAAGPFYFAINAVAGDAGFVAD